MIRLFTAIPLPEPLRTRIALLQGGIPGARWAVPDNYHITLDFIGEVDEDTAERADEALSSVHANRFNLHLTGADCFSEGNRPLTLWLGVGESPTLRDLKNKTLHALDAARVPVEHRKYTPHLTLARLKNPDPEKLADFLRDHLLFASPTFPVDHFRLYQSRSTKNGAVYEALRAYPL